MLEFGPNDHTICGFWDLVPEWHFYWTLWACWLALGPAPLEDLVQAPHESFGRRSRRDDDGTQSVVVAPIETTMATNSLPKRR